MHFLISHLSAFEELSDSNGIQTHNLLVRKRTLSHLAKLLEFLLQTKWLRVRIPLLSLNNNFCHYNFYHF